ncbi:fibronectin type III domain-containing protein [Patescibacteria group bacterium]
MAISGQKILKKNIIKILFALGLVTMTAVILRIYFSLDKTPKELNKNSASLIAESEENNIQKMVGADTSDIGPLGLNLSILRRKEFIDLQNNSTYTPPLGGQKDAMVIDYNIPPALKIFNIDDPGIGNQLNLFWTKNDNVVIKYVRIYRFEEEDLEGELIAELNGNRTNFIDTNLDYNKKYYYLLKTVNTEGYESTNIKKYIGITTNVIPPASPYDIEIQQKDENLEILWSNPQDYDLKKIVIYRSEKDSELGEIVAEIEAVPNKKYKWSDNKIDMYKTYYYHLSAVDEVGNMSASNIVNIGNKELFISEIKI